MSDPKSEAGFSADDTQEPFTPFINIWNTIGTRGMIPITMLYDRTKFSWPSSIAFMTVETSIEAAVGIPSSVAIIGGDDPRATYTMIHHDMPGVPRQDQQTINGRGETSQDGSSWEQDLNLIYTRIQEYNG